MGSGKFIVLLLSCWQIGASSAVQAAGENSAPLAQGTIDIVERKVPCSTAEFSDFFRVFVRGLDDRLPRTAVRNAYVWPQVEVRSDRNPNQLAVDSRTKDLLKLRHR